MSTQSSHRPYLSSPPPLPRLHYLVISLLIIPSFLGVGSPWVNNGVHSRGIPSRLSKLEDEDRKLESRQTLAEQSIPASEYEWSGEGDGTDICVRWSHQSAIVGGKMYIFGGQSKTDPDSEMGNWNANFFQLDLEKEWPTGSPSLEALNADGLPAVSNGYLWHDLENIYLFGGLFSDRPHVAPPANSLWTYNINSGSWSETKEDEFRVSDDSAQKKVERAAEGAGCTVIKDRDGGVDAKGYYFGGHLDAYTTEGWSHNVERVYLKSMVEFDMGSKQWRNVSEGSGLDKAGVPERADGVLVYAPLGKEGILVGIGGGREKDFQQLNVVDVYDIASSTWYRQATSGPAPKYRVNPCAAVSSAPDMTSHNIYFFGGQNLQPYREQIQYDDMWILTLPSFTWVEVDQSSGGVPPPRAGHTCHIYNGQFIVVGGFVGNELSCDSPGIYVFDVASLKWKTSYTPPEDNTIPFEPGLAFLNVAQVPKAVQKAIGGSANGGATATVPAATPDPDSPLAGGPVFTVTTTAENGEKTTIVTTKNPHVSTSLAHPSNIPDDAIEDPDSSSSNSKSKTGAIVGGVLGGIVFLLAMALLGAWLLYKRKLKEFRRERLGSVSDRGSLVGAPVAAGDGRSSEMKAAGSTGDLLGEPSFWGVMVARKRSLRVVNN